MEIAKVISWVDIEAPLKEVYEAVLHVERRMQLSPLWGAAILENVDAESTYNNSNAQGLDYFGLPQTRSYGLNLKVGF